MATARLSNASLATVTQFESEVLYQYTLNEDVRVVIDRLVGDAEPVEAVRVVRAELRSQDISQQLRGTLGVQ